jgi:hypothetical protein
MAVAIWTVVIENSPKDTLMLHGNSVMRHNPARL